MISCTLEILENYMFKYIFFAGVILFSVWLVTGIHEDVPEKVSDDSKSVIENKDDNKIEKIGTIGGITLRTTTIDQVVSCYGEPTAKGETDGMSDYYMYGHIDSDGNALLEVYYNKETRTVTGIITRQDCNLFTYNYRRTGDFAKLSYPNNVIIEDNGDVRYVYKKNGELLEYWISNDWIIHTIHSQVTDYDEMESINKGMISIEAMKGEYSFFIDNEYNVQVGDYVEYDNGYGEVLYHSNGVQGHDEDGEYYFPGLTIYQDKTFITDPSENSGARLIGIIWRSEKVSTSKGVCVGSSEDDVLAKYGGDASFRIDVSGYNGKNIDETNHYYLGPYILDKYDRQAGIKSEKRYDKYEDPIRRSLNLGRSLYGSNYPYILFEIENKCVKSIVVSDGYIGGIGGTGSIYKCLSDGALEKLEKLGE